MRSLFLKIFLWFWLALALIVATLVGVNLLGRPENAIFEMRRGSGPFGLYARLAVDAFESQDPQRWVTFRDDIFRENRMRATLVDAAGRPLTAGPVTLTGLAAARRALARGETIFVGERRSTFIALPVRGRDGASYVFLLEHQVNRPRRGPMPFIPPGRESPLLAAAVLTAGVVCFGLARYLAAPVRRLREATRRFAAGDLSARAVRPGDRRQDELADLGRDFDRMADRVEGLIMAQRELLRDVSHELRSPLARLGVALELGRSGAPADVPVALERIEREASRLNELIARILALSRLETRGLSLLDDEVDLARLLAEIRDDASFEASGRGGDVRLSRLEPHVLRGSRDLLRSAFENVVRNAVRHTAASTTVEIELTGNANGGAMILIRDHGPGVPAAQLDDMFRPYERLDIAGDGGSGLGLTIARRVIEAHSGAIVARNRQGQGLDVEIRLPLAVAIPAPS